MNIFKIIKDWFEKTPSTPKFMKRGTGVVRDDPDMRDVALAAIQSKVSTPDTYFGPLHDILRKLDVLDQYWQPMCVPHAFVGLFMGYIYRKTGQTVKLSARYLSKLVKMFDGMPEVKGTYPRVGALMITKFGCCTEELLKNETTLSEEKYHEFELTDEMVDNAVKHKAPGFAYVNRDIESVKNGIYQNGAVAGTTIVGNWNDLPLKKTPPIGAHYTIWTAYEKIGYDYKIYIKNSWGKGWLAWILGWVFPGHGYFMWNDYKDSVAEIIALADIPDDYLKIVKSMPYKFTKHLSKGMTDMQVRELQKMLNQSPDTAVAIEGAGSPGQETLYFGAATQAALVKWQQKKGISPQSGYFGPLSLAKANEGVYTNKIHEWALATQTFEGWFPGSRSYKNNNPGNIRYTGIFASMAIGKDDKNFCVFSSYEKGLDALKTLLTRAAKGLSSVYRPDDTLLQFYQKYAPASDNNHPETYARAIAKRIGVTIETKIKNLI